MHTAIRRAVSARPPRRRFSRISRRLLPCALAATTAALAACAPPPSAQAGVAAAPVASAASTPAASAPSAPAASAAPTSAGQPATILERTQAEIGRAGCSSDAQCRTLAYGEKPCGGPQAWLAWSIAESDAGRLAALAAESVRAAKAQQAQSGMVSNCRYLPDPGARCLVGRCVLNTGRGAV